MPQLVILGNSRVYHNIDPDSFHVGAINLAHNGTGQYFQTGLLHVLRQARKLPPALVLHIDLDEYAAPPKTEEIRQLNFYYHHNNYVTKHIDAISWAERVKNLSALYRHNGRIFSLLKAVLRPTTTPDYGFKPVAPSSRDSINTLYSVQHRWAQPRLHNREPLRALQEFVKLCRVEKVKLVCFTSPYYQPPPYLQETSALVDSLLRAEHVAYINYGLHPIATLQHSTRYWRDDNHLNALGVPLQSQRLAQQVADLLDEEQTPFSSTLSSNLASESEQSIRLVNKQ